MIILALFNHTIIQFMKHLLFLLLITTCSVVQGQQNTYNEIRNTLNKYIQGAAQGNRELLKEAFYKDFKLYMEAQDTLRIIDGKQYIENVVPGKKYNRVAKIRSIDVENNAALAKIEVFFPDQSRLATDYILMLKTGQGWKILHKIIDLKYLDKPEITNEKEIGLINATLNDYIIGTAESDVPRIEKAFQEGLNLYYIKERNIAVIKRNNYIENFKKNNYNRIGKVLSIDYEGTAASAKLEVIMPNRNRTVIDYLTLLKLDGTWKIIHKSFADKKYD